jgi:NADPH:quinone reductase-like Zn-dependent oxidoreductase
MKVKAIGINRAECLQRQGKYNSNNLAENLLGLEAAGEIYNPLTK